MPHDKASLFAPSFSFPIVQSENVRCKLIVNVYIY